MRGHGTLYNTIGIARAALSHEQCKAPFCSSVRPKQAAAREEYICYWRVARVGLAHSLVLTIADSVATLEGRPAAARAATFSAISECRVYNLDDRDVIGKEVWRASSIEPYA